MSTNFPAFSTIVDLMQYRSNHQPEQQGYIFLTDGESQEISLTYRELDAKAQLIATHLQSLNMTTIKTEMPLVLRCKPIFK